MRRVALRELPGGCWMYNLTQKLTAEFIGTFALIFFGAGAVCVDMQLRTNATGGIGLLAIALAHGAYRAPYTRWGADSLSRLRRK